MRVAHVLTPTTAITRDWDCGDDDCWYWYDRDDDRYYWRDHRDYWWRDRWGRWHRRW
jgi:hypothetical protein